MDDRTRYQDAFKKDFRGGSKVKEKSDPSRGGIIFRGAIMHQIWECMAGINPELNIVGMEAASQPGPVDISGRKHGPTRHYSTVSRNNPPIYPEPGKVADLIGI